MLATFFLGHQPFGPPKMSLVLRPPVAWSLILRTGLSEPIVVVVVVVVVVPHKDTGRWEKRPSCGRAKSHEANHVHLADVDNDVKMRQSYLLALFCICFSSS